MTKENNARYLVVLLAIAGPFYPNDFASIYVKDWRWWLAIDYVSVKLFPLVVIAWLIVSKRMELAEFGLTGGPTRSMPSPWQRSCTRFTPKHECKRSRNYARDDTRPNRNENAMHCDFPPQSDAKQLQQRDKRENDDGHGSKGFQS